MLTFNSHGYLVPNDLIRSTLEELHETFVVQYSSTERILLFESYLNYSNDLKNICGVSELSQWIDGSFISRSKLRPSDIDMVTFLDHQLIIDLGDKLSPFKYPNSKLKYPGIDGYIVGIYEDNSPHHYIYLGDKLQWSDEFTRARRNRAGIKHPKGFLEINY